MDKEKIKKNLSKEIPKNQILVNEPMKKYTSFKIGGNADILVKVNNIDELKYVIKVAEENNIYLTVIGNGSNILVKDEGIRGIVVKLEFTDIEISDEIVTVGAGVKLGELAQKLLKKELAGFEFAAGIPGTIGGAVRMNAGAYGKEMQDIIIETKCLDVNKYKKIIERNNIDDIEITEDVEIIGEPEIIKLDNHQQKFSYRHSIFMEKKYIVLETKLKLCNGKYKEIKSKMDEYMAKRREKQPLNMPSAGSTFKRGEDYITAKLIDECGLKGYTIGGAQVSDVHAGFIINKGNATATDVIKLIDYVQKVVYEKEGKKIELEIEILGE